VSDRVGLVHCDGAAFYDHGPGHPLRPDRVLLTWALIRAYGLEGSPNVVGLQCSEAEDRTLGLVHTREFIDATRRAGHGEDGPWARFGYGPGDNPIFDRMHEAGAAVTGASVEAARAVWASEVEHAFNAAGGLHHAMPDHASGFCVYDDPAVAIAWLLANGAERVAYVDVDVHHGDGVQSIFYDDPRVLTISIHQYAPWFFFPGTGGLTERGGPNAEGSAVNIPLPPNTGDEAWLSAFREVVPPLVRRFRPDVLVSQLGCDTHASDPLAQLELTTRAYREAGRELHALAHEAAGARWVATGGGGYEWARVVPRAWTIYFAEMAGTELPDELPEGWIEEAERRLRGPVPATLSEPSLEPGRGDAEAAEVVATLRRTVVTQP
jgi:acetoin utilization protein AcuC